MHPEDAKKVLACAAAYDKRKPSQTETVLWAADLGDTTLSEAVNAVREHFKTRPDVYLQVGHVIEIVKRYRRTGLDQSARLENAAITALDPDDPDYTRKYQLALQAARHRAASDTTVIPGQVALPGGTVESRVERTRRGVALARAAVEAATAKRKGGTDEQPLTESERIVAAARERAAEERRSRTYRGDPRPIADTLHHIRRNR